MYNVCVSGGFSHHMLTYANMYKPVLRQKQDNDSFTPPRRLRALVFGLLPRVLWVTDPTYTHVFRLKEENITSTERQR